jgi:peptidyl-prolyl cis-trans isomerase D
MLEQMRKSSQSLLIYVLFGIVIAVFIINFGPQSRGGSGCSGAMGGDETAAEVAGQSVSAQSYLSAFKLVGGGNYPVQMLKAERFKERVMDKLIERELLAQEAERLGYSVGEDDVHKMLLDGRVLGLGNPQSIVGLQKNGVFNYDSFKSYTQFQLGLTPDRFVQQQQRELLAAEVRDLMRATIKVSAEEVKSAYDFKSRQLNLEYVRFPARKYEGEIEPTADERAAYIKANEAKLKETFTQRKQMYTDMPQEVRLRQILLKAPPAPEAAAQDAAEAATKAQKEAAEAALKKRAELLAARVAKGEAFAKVAREASDDEDGRNRAGDLGWRRKGTLGLAEADEAKLFAAKAGEVMGPFKTDQGVSLFLVGGTRTGTLTFDQVKGDLADEKIKQEKAAGVAKQKAEAALAAAQGAADKSLKDLFAGDGSPKAGPAKAGPAKAGAAKAGAKQSPPALPDARAEETGLFAYRGSVIEQIGDSAELAKAAWALTTAAPLAGPFNVADSYVVVRLKERKEPDAAEFEKQKTDLQRDAELKKWDEVFTNWVKARCREAKATGRLTVNKTVLKYEDAQEPPPYEACVGETSRRPS